MQIFWNALHLFAHRRSADRSTGELKKPPPPQLPSTSSSTTDRRHNAINYRSVRQEFYRAIRRTRACTGLAVCGLGRRAVCERGGGASRIVLRAGNGLECESVDQ